MLLLFSSFLFFFIGVAVGMMFKQDGGQTSRGGLNPEELKRQQSERAAQARYSIRTGQIIE